MRDEADAQLLEDESETAEAMIAAVKQSGFNVPPSVPSHASHDAEKALAQKNLQATSKFHFLDGSSTDVAWAFKDTYLDEYTLEHFAR